MSMAEFHVVGLDTGRMSGVAAVTITPVGISHSASEYPWIPAVAYAERWAKEGAQQRPGYVSLCWERYDNMPGRRVLSAQPEAQMANGALEYVATQCGVTFQQQSRVDAKKVVTDAVLRRLGWYKKTKDGHANDASRQVGLFLHVRHPELWLQLTDRV